MSLRATGTLSCVVLALLSGGVLAAPGESARDADHQVVVLPRADGLDVYASRVSASQVRGAWIGSVAGSPTQGCAESYQARYRVAEDGRQATWRSVTWMSADGRTACAVHEQGHRSAPGGVENVTPLDSSTVRALYRRPAFRFMDELGVYREDFRAQVR